MIKSRTVFVLGAGASKEVRLPTGDELKSDIAKKLRTEKRNGLHAVSDTLLQSALMHAVNDAEWGRDTLPNYVKAAQRIADAMPLTKSIDNYIEAHEQDARVKLCGKLAITNCILEAENKSLLRSSSQVPDFSRVSETWFNHFFGMLSEACPRSKIETMFENVSMVNFNYDRCVEHFFTEAIRCYYNCDLATADACIGAMLHVHPYGTVAPWREHKSYWPFGDLIRSPEDLLDYAKRIRTYSEQSSAPEGLSALHSAIAGAETIVFMGFAYHPMNMSLLQPADRTSAARRIYATTHGMSDADRRAIDRQIRDLFPQCPAVSSDNVHLINARCNEFFRDYSRLLASR